MTERREISDDTTVIKTSRAPGELRGHLQRWLQGRTNDPNATIGPVTSPEANGMSSESLFFDASWNGSSGSFVARLAPAANDVPLFMEYDLEKQYLLIDLVAERTAVPVPRLAWLETDASYLDVPFFVMHKAEGRVPSDIPPYARDGWVRELGAEGQADLQRKSVDVIAGVHDIDISDGCADFLAFDAATGDTPLARHFADQKRYYEWVCEGAGTRIPAIEAAMAWVEANWPDDDSGVVSWGDSRIGNIMYAHEGTDPVAVFDWEMATIAPRGLDVGWMCFMHRFFEYLLGLGGIETLPDMLRPEEVREQYRAASGVDVGDLRFEMAYNAMRHAIIMSRLHVRSVHFRTAEWPDDPDDAFLFKGLVEELISD